MLLELEFPVTIGYGSISIPTYSTSVGGSKTGWETRNSDWESSRSKFNAAMLVRRQDQLDILRNFFHTVRGKWIPFRFKDWGDFKSCGVDETISYDDQIIIASAVGGEDEFLLHKIYSVGSFSTTKIITQPLESSVIVAKDTGTGLVELANPGDFTMVDGKINLVTPLIAGDKLTAGFEFFLPMRFKEDELPVDLEAYQVGSASVPLFEVRIKTT